MIRAWKFLRADRKLRYADGRELTREWLTDPRDEGGKIVTAPSLCHHGFHASEHPRDALRYAQGMTLLARVEVDGEVVRGEDKLAGTRIRLLWAADTEKVLREFAVWCRWRQFETRLGNREPHLASLWALDCAERYLRGEADRDELEAARSAAHAADAAYAAYAAAYAAADAAYAAYAADDAADAAYAADAAADAAYAADDAYAEKQAIRDEFLRRCESLTPKEHGNG